MKQEQEVIFDYIHAYCYGGLDGKYLDNSLSYNILGLSSKFFSNFFKLHDFKLGVFFSFF